MTITLRWWLIPIALFLIGCFMTVRAPKFSIDTSVWLFLWGLALCVAAVGLVVGKLFL